MMKRYEPNIDSSDTFQGMQENPNGGYVEYEDYNRLRELLKEIRKLEVPPKDFKPDYEEWFNLVGEIVLKAFQKKEGEDNIYKITGMFPNGNWYTCNICKRVKRSDEFYLYENGSRTGECKDCKPRKLIKRAE